MGYPHREDENGFLLHSYTRKVNSLLIKNSCKNEKPIKYIKDFTERDLYNFRIWKNPLHKTQKTQSIKKMLIN